MKNKYLIISLTCILFLVVAFVCLNTLFSVRDITVEYSVVGADSAEEVESLLEKYKGKSIFFVDVDDVKEEITSDRYLKVVSVKKIYPCELYVSLSERTEKFYCAGVKDGTSGYYLFDEEFFVTHFSEDLPSNSSGLIGIDFIDRMGGRSPDLALKRAVDFPHGANDLILRCVNSLGGQAPNVRRLTVVCMPEGGNVRIALKTAEGVTIELWGANILLEEKTVSALQYYLTLSESEKICGSIITSLVDGEVTCTYTKNSTGTFN